MKKMFTAALLLLFVSLTAFSSGKKKYDDVRKLFLDYSKVVENFYNDLVDANDKVDEKAVVESINFFIEKTEEFNIQMGKLAKKYPELNDENNVPADLMKEIEAIFAKMESYSQTLEELSWDAFEGSPELLEALQKLENL